MKKIIAWLLVLALTAAISIGATLAYLTDTDEDVNVMTLGNVKIDQLEYERIDDETKNEDAEVQEFHDNKPLYPAVTDKDFDYTPGDSYVDWEQIGKEDYTSDIWNPEDINNELDKMVFVKNKGKSDAYVRTVFAFEAGKYETLDEFQSMMHLNLNETDWTWEWLETPVTIGDTAYFVATATYNNILAPGALTEISLSQIALDKTATNADVEAFGETYQILVKSQGIQAEGFETAVMALDEGFGGITLANIPWETDLPLEGASMMAALHKNPAGETVTSKITKVVYGLNKDYPEIADNYDGVLTTEDQDVSVYAYHVADGSEYTVYFLANGKIYLPKVSTSMFESMTALTSVDTSNLDTSRCEMMDYLFYKSAKLTDVDVSGFDTGNATTMRSMFNGCTKLESIDVSNWDTSKVTDFSNFVKNCDSMESIDLSGLDLDSDPYMEYVFNGCDNLKTVDLTGLDTSNVVSTRGMFMNCYAVEEIIGHEDLDLSNNTDMYYMFQHCHALEYLDVSNWDTSNVTEMHGTFFECHSLKAIEGFENWDTSKVTNMCAMFQNNYNMVSVEGIGNFKTGNVEDMSHMFYGCSALEEVDVANWDVSKVKYFNSMFSGSGHNTGDMKFTYMEVDNWDVSSAVNMECMFYSCGNLIELDLSNWRTPLVTNFRHTFADCFKLERIDFTGWDTSSAENFDGMFNDCYSLTELDLSDFDTGNATTFAQFFEGCGGLTTVKGMENWDVSKVTNMAQLFNSNGKDMHLEYVDMSAFNTLSLEYTDNMFSGCYRLKTVYAGDGWDMSKVTNSGAMFSGCSALVGGNGTTTAGNPTDGTYARVDTAETPGYLTYKSANP